MKRTWAGAAGDRIAAAAHALAGAPFRLHGRDPATGLDCVGLVWLALRNAGFPCEAPRRYALRNASIAQHLHFVDRAGLLAAHGAAQPGDILLLRCAPAQFHLAVAAQGSGIVHAHAGLRKVVAMPGPLPWPLIRMWRLPPETKAIPWPH